MTATEVLPGLYYAVGVLAAVVAVAGAIYLARARRRLADAETVETLTRAATELVVPLREEVKLLRERLSEQRVLHEERDTVAKEAVRDLREKHEDCLRREGELNTKLDHLLNPPTATT